MTAEQARRAFDASSGEIYASLLADAGEQGQARAWSLLGLANEAAPQGWSLWGAVTGRDGGLDGDGNAGEVDSSSLGLELGMRYEGAGFAIGLAGGWIDGEADVAARGSEVRHDGWRVGALGRIGSGHEGFSASAAFDYAALDGRVVRNIAFVGLNRTTAADVSVDVLTLAGALRYGFALGGGWAAGPVVSLVHTSADLDEVDESGADALDLSSNGASEGLTRFGAGVFAGPRGPNGSLDLSVQYVGGDANLAGVTLALDGAPGAPFTVVSPRGSADGALAGISGRFELAGGWAIGGQASALIRGDGSSISGRAWVGIRF